jgi:hypothetical protein
MLKSGRSIFDNDIYHTPILPQISTPVKPHRRSEAPLTLVYFDESPYVFLKTRRFRCRSRPAFNTNNAIISKAQTFELFLIFVLFLRYATISPEAR